MSKQPTLNELLETCADLIECNCGQDKCTGTCTHATRAEAEGHNASLEARAETTNNGGS